MPTASSGSMVSPFFLPWMARWKATRSKSSPLGRADPSSVPLRMVTALDRAASETSAMAAPSASATVYRARVAGSSSAVRRTPRRRWGLTIRAALAASLVAFSSSIRAAFITVSYPKPLVSSLRTALWVASSSFFRTTSVRLTLIDPIALMLRGSSSAFAFAFAAAFAAAAFALFCFLPLALPVSSSSPATGGKAATSPPSPYRSIATTGRPATPRTPRSVRFCPRSTTSAARAANDPGGATPGAGPACEAPPW
mmetsp:Transcript_34364/g.101028  ORF Transcript_34364/g.101028 Transcript_34364/m.101028 type:complete len:254 (-) Transcript_34364:100-861(-)